MAKQLSINFDNIVNSEQKATTTPKVKYIPTINQLAGMYRDINQRYFVPCGIKMPDIVNFEIKKITKRWLACAGCSGRYYRQTRKKFTPFDNFLITFNVMYKDSFKGLYNTMAHEMCHIAVYLNLDYVPRDSHGREFMHYAGLINAKSEGKIHVTKMDDVGDWEFSDEVMEKHPTTEMVMFAYEGLMKPGEYTYFLVKCTHKHAKQLALQYSTHCKAYALCIAKPTTGLLLSAKSRRSTLAGLNDENINNLCKRFEEKYQTKLYNKSGWIEIR